MTTDDQFQTVTMTVGKLDASLALLTTDEHHVVEFPTILLPHDIETGSVVEFKVRHNKVKEEENEQDFYDLQNEIFEKYGKNEPQAPILSIMNVTQTSCVLQWDELDLGSTQLKSLSLWKFVPGVAAAPFTSDQTTEELDDRDSVSSLGNGFMERITIIPNPMTTHNFKISGLGVDSKYKFQLKLDTSNGLYVSELLTVNTHVMTDMSGITCCLGALDYEKYKVTAKDIEACVSEMGGKLPLQTKVSIDTTHFITNENENDNEDKDVELTKAKRFNIPIVKPEWVRACQLEKKIIGVKGFYYKNGINDDQSKNFKFDKEYTKAYLNTENRKSVSSVEKKPLEELNSLDEPLQEDDMGHQEEPSQEPAEETTKNEKEEPTDFSTAQSVEEVAVEKAAIETPTTVEPLAKEIAIEEPATEAAATEKDVTEKDVTEKDVTEELATEKDVTEELATEKDVTELQKSEEKELAIEKAEIAEPVKESEVPIEDKKIVDEEKLHSVMTDETSELEPQGSEDSQASGESQTSAQTGGSKNKKKNKNKKKRGKK